MNLLYPLKSRKAALRLALLILTLLPVAACGSPEDRAKSYYDEGMKLMAVNDNARAAVEFKNAVKVKKITSQLGLHWPKSRKLITILPAWFRPCAPLSNSTRRMWPIE